LAWLFLELASWGKMITGREYNTLDPEKEYYAAICTWSGAFINGYPGDHDWGMDNNDDLVDIVFVTHETIFISPLESLASAYFESVDEIVSSANKLCRETKYNIYILTKDGHDPESCFICSDHRYYLGNIIRIRIR
jgi:hypothetical protein